MLIIFDLDGTIVVNSKFYKKVYSGTLGKTIIEERGKQGLKMLQYCRANYDGKGELALLALNIPFNKWAQKLIEAPLDLVPSQPRLVKDIQTLNAKKVIYSGSPLEMACGTLEKMGFSPKRDFDLIIGWQPPEVFPVKWSCTTTIFQTILDKFNYKPDQAWAVGDNWQTDLLPAKKIGLKTAEIRHSSGQPDFYFSNLNKFITFLK